MTYEPYVTISLEPEEDHPVAEIGYRGNEIAIVRRIGDDWLVTLGAGGSSDVPFDRLRTALDEAAKRLGIDAADSSSGA